MVGRLDGDFTDADIMAGGKHILRSYDRRLIFPDRSESLEISLGD